MSCTVAYSDEAIAEKKIFDDANYYKAPDGTLVNSIQTQTLKNMINTLSKKE